MKYNDYLNIISKIGLPKDIPEFNTEGKLIICLIEYRIMEEIKYVLNAVLNIYDSKDIGLSIVYGLENKEYIEDNFSNWKNILLINTNNNVKDRYEYSAMLKKPQFWENFKNWSHILIYQCDALLLRKIDEVYFNYDYIGAPWESIDNWKIKKPPKYNGGNGGFSLRRIEKMIECCEENRYIENISKDNEDVFFCRCNLNFIEEKSVLHRNFSIETIYGNNPVGIHQLYRYIDNIMTDVEEKKFWDEIKKRFNIDV
tara:strand:- start:142 stop:909 length:768 start_codon:yes stop_codon:yes gene_type:complete